MTDEELDNVANAAVKELLATGPMSPQRFHEAAKATRRALFNAGAAKAESRVRELEAEVAQLKTLLYEVNRDRKAGEEQVRELGAENAQHCVDFQSVARALGILEELPDQQRVLGRIEELLAERDGWKREALDWRQDMRLVADSSAALAKAREALEAYEAARSGSIDEHDAFVELRAALATQTPAEQDGRVAAVRRVADGPHPDTITVISDDHDHYYVPASALVDAQERIAELEALAGQATYTEELRRKLGIARGLLYAYRGSEPVDLEELDRVLTTTADPFPPEQLMQPAEPEKP